MKDHTIPIWLMAISGTVGLVLLCIALSERLRMKKAKGKITDISKEDHTEKNAEHQTILYFPIVEFHAFEKSEKIRFKDQIGTSGPLFKIGNSIDIIYDPSNPSKAYVSQGFRRYWFTLFFFFVAALCSLPLIIK